MLEKNVLLTKDNGCMLRIWIYDEINACLMFVFYVIALPYQEIRTHLKREINKLRRVITFICFIYYFDPSCFERGFFYSRSIVACNKNS